jgi:LysR family hydrogen peroxide-inducible transcriptional activator
MNLTQLRALVAVAEHGSFSAAARDLHTVQSNISGHIAHLEQQLGVALVDRSSGQLTLEGDVVVNRARRILDECNGVTVDITSRHQTRGISRVGMIGTTARWLAPALVGALTACHPAVHLVVTENNSIALTHQLTDRAIDAAVLSTPTPVGGLALTPLFDEELLLVVPPGHKLANNTDIDVETLCRLELLLPPPDSAYRPELDAAAALHGITLRPKAEFDGVRLIASLTFDGHGASVLPATAIPSWLRDRCQVVHIPNLPNRRVALARRTGDQLSPAATAVTELLQQVVAEGARTGLGIRACPLDNPATDQQHTT